MPASKTQSSLTADEVLSRLEELSSVTAKLARLQASLAEGVEARDYDTVQANLVQKQTLIDQLAVLPQLETTFADSKDKWTSQEQGAFQETLGRLQTAIQSIARHEETTIRTIQAHRQQAAEELRELTQHRQATRSYKKNETASARSRIDLTG